MKRFSLIVALFFSTLVLFANDDDKLKLAVMEFEDLSGKLPQKMLTDATEYMRGAFVSSNRYVVIAKERQEKAMIKEMKKESYKSCNDKNCQIPLGQALSADTILRTTITFFGGSYTITSELIDLAKEATVKAARSNFDGSEKSLKKALDEIVKQIISVQSLSSSPTPPITPAPTPAPAQAASNNNDAVACQFARKEATKETWEFYLKTFPNGICAFEAFVTLTEIKKNDDKKAVEAAKEAERKRKGILYWSTKAPQKMNWGEAIYYCKNLDEGGYNDWRLPNIDELRSLVTNCESTISTALGGTCEITQNCLSWRKCNNNCSGCGVNNRKQYNKFGYKDWFWSSSTQAEDESFAYYVDFDNGKIDRPSKKYKGKVLCVR